MVFSSEIRITYISALLVSNSHVSSISFIDLCFPIILVRFPPMCSLFIYSFDRSLFSALSVLITALQLKVQRGADGKGPGFIDTYIHMEETDYTPRRQINTHDAFT